MKIEKVKTESVKPYENNAKLHPPSQIEQIKKSIKEFGNNDPIAIDENGVIIEGHGRYLALKDLGYEEIEVIRLGHLSEEQKRAYVIIHNKLTMNTGFNLDVLSEEMQKLKSIDLGNFDLDTETYREEKEEPYQQEEHEFIQMVFMFNIEQYKLIEKAIEDIDKLTFDAFGNKHKNGNKVYEVVKRWAEQKKLN